MIKALIIMLLVFGLIAGLILTLRRTAGLGNPPKEMLERAKRRAQAQAAEEDEED